ncbi:hypothetical protein M3Y99_00937400 [Aphelenchoides fujianensis]|nr:hypothetical protein M3Y99_00937400 [Aphelenchoides fujianensis]
MFGSNNHQAGGPMRSAVGRVHTCGRCQNHGFRVALRNHAQVCPFALCSCHKCTCLLEYRATINQRRKLAESSRRLEPWADPWNPALRPFLNPLQNANVSCEVTYPQRSRLDASGRLEVQKANWTEEECSYRCIEMPDDNTFDFRPWTRMVEEKSRFFAQPNCDVFDLRCEVDNQTTFKWLHSQVVERSDRLNEVKTRKTDTELPDVHILVLDSVSMDHVLRALRKTVHYVRSIMGGVEIAHLNKVGMNSRPNAYAFLLGERAEDLPANPWWPAMDGGRLDELCNKQIKDENFIGFDFQRAGYRTMINEDFAATVFHERDCAGFGTRPADHYFRAHAARISFTPATEDPDYARILFKQSCQERQDPILHHLRDFIHKYPHTPKFSLSWITMLAHNDANSLYHADGELANFFRENDEKFANSFVFLMADHGPTFGPLRRSKAGRVEANNPFLFVTLPRHLRDHSDLVQQIYENSQQLTTQFDVYASLLELAEVNTRYPMELYEYANPAGGSNRFFKLVFMAKPSGGIHEAYAEMDEKKNIRFVVEKFPRLTVFHFHSSCIPPGFLQNYCHCKHV